MCARTFVGRVHFRVGHVEDAWILSTADPPTSWKRSTVFAGTRMAFVELNVRAVVLDELKDMSDAASADTRMKFARAFGSAGVLALESE